MIEATDLASHEAAAQALTLDEQKILALLAPYEPVSATLAWFQTLRGIEECINFLTADWDEEGIEQQLLLMPVAALVRDEAPLAEAIAILTARFSRNVAVRFEDLVRQGAALARIFAGHGYLEGAAAFHCVGTMILYLQSRRRHFVGLLHRMPSACRGQRVVGPSDMLAICLPIIELVGIRMMGKQNALNIAAARERLRLPAAPADELPMLDSLFLEPERLRITETAMAVVDTAAFMAAREVLLPDRLFSAAELRNDILLAEAAYAEFGLRRSSFAPAAELVRLISRRHVDKDFWVAITPAELARLFSEVDASPALRAAFVNRSAVYMDCLSTYAPLVRIDETYRSSVTLLSRFIYNWRARCLENVRRYQIRSGFLFEKAVTVALEEQGFRCQGITRIDHKEFDVVTVRCGIVWNVQCKNNFIDLDRVDCDAAHFARYNARLVRSYEKALRKEAGREQLLRAKLGLERVEHMLVSRFPVVSDNDRILPFSRIETFSKAADSLLRAR